MIVYLYRISLAGSVHHGYQSHTGTSLNESHFKNVLITVSLVETIQEFRLADI